MQLVNFAAEASSIAGRVTRGIAAFHATAVGIMQVAGVGHLRLTVIPARSRMCAIARRNLVKMNMMGFRVRSHQEVIEPRNDDV